MQTYWDFTEKERAELTREEVTAMLDAHLMTKGVLKVKPVELVPVPERPQLTRVKMFSVNDTVFATIQQAQAFLELQPQRLDYDYYLSDSSLKYAKMLDLKIEEIMVCDRTELTNMSSVLKQIKAATEKNEAARRDFEKADEAVQNCLNEVWRDYYAQQATRDKHARVIATWNEYLALSGGDRNMASGFLKKAFDVLAIRDASAFTGVEIPTEFLPQAAGVAEPVEKKEAVEV